MADNKSDKVIWWLMITFAGILIIGGGAWATDVTQKVNKIYSVEKDIDYIKESIKDIKNILLSVRKKQEALDG